MHKRKKYPKELKARVALEALKGEKTIAEISSEYEVHSNMITKWKKQLKEHMPDIFIRKWKKQLKEHMPDIFIRKNEQEPDEKQLIENLYKQIGQSQMEVNWLKKKLGL